MNYSAFNVFARGYSHIQNNTVCQDASYSYSDENHSIVVVADGHGSKQYCRSDRGAQLAVDCTVQVIEECLSSECLLELFCTPNRYNDTLSKICNSIIAKWHLAIEKEIAANPFTEEELTEIPEKYAQNYREHRYIEKAYGTTLIAVFTVGERCFGLQIGDGKCVALYKNGTMNEPIPWDERCCFNVTTSLCDAEASQEFRFAEINEPIAVFIGTDGIDDTYGTGLFHFYLNVAEKINELGYEESVSQLKNYMSDISEKGSHDDVSLACIIDIVSLPLVLPDIIHELNMSKLELELQKLQTSLPDKVFRVQKETAIINQLLEDISNCKDNEELNERLNLAEKNLENAKEDLNQHESRIDQLQKEIMICSSEGKNENET